MGSPAAYMTPARQAVGLRETALVWAALKPYGSAKPYKNTAVQSPSYGEARLEFVSRGEAKGVDVEGPQFPLSKVSNLTVSSGERTFKIYENDVDNEPHSWISAAKIGKASEARTFAVFGVLTWTLAPVESCRMLCFNRETILSLESWYYIHFII